MQAINKLVKHGMVNAWNKLAWFLNVGSLVVYFGSATKFTFGSVIIALVRRVL